MSLEWGLELSRCLRNLMWWSRMWVHCYSKQTPWARRFRHCQCHQRSWGCIGNMLVSWKTSRRSWSWLFAMDPTNCCPTQSCKPFLPRVLRPFAKKGSKLRREHRGLENLVLCLAKMGSQIRRKHRDLALNNIEAPLVLLNSFFLCNIRSLRSMCPEAAKALYEQVALAKTWQQIHNDA